MKQHKPTNIVLALVLVYIQTARAQVFVPSLPDFDGPHASMLYRVCVRPLAGGAWQEVHFLVWQ